MSNFYYTDANGQRQGAFTSSQLKALVAQGIITPDTPLETDTGHKGLAGQVKGLFPVPSTASAPVAVPTHANASASIEHTQSEHQEIIDQIYDYAANLMINEKRSATETVNALVDQGLNTEQASTVVANIMQHIKTAKKSSGGKNMLFGALWCIGGTIVTAATYSAVAETGGTYVVAWGAILFGGIQFLYGMVEYFTN